MLVIQPVDIGRDLRRDIDIVAASTLDDTVMCLPVALALLGCGRFDRVASLLRRARPAPTLPLTLGRYVAWSGDLHTAAAAWQHVRASLPPLTAAIRDNDPDDTTVILAAAGFQAIAQTATDLGDPRLAATILPHARAARVLAAGRRLSPDAARLAAALRITTPPIALAAGTDASAMDTDAPATDSNAPTIRDAVTAAEPTAAALRILDLCDVALGLDPDATRHRLRLRPRVLPGVSRLEVRNIGFGDGTISLLCQWAPDRMVFTIAQDSGAIPATALLEPVLAGGFGRALVDDMTADLQPRSEGDSMILPVQLVLDAERVLVVELTDERPPT